jgi:hypothetical protein
VQAHRALDRVLDDAFSEPEGRQLKRTRAVVVLHQGEVVAERYAPGDGADTRLTGWSMSKSVLNALISILELLVRYKRDLGKTRYPSAWEHDRFVAAVLAAFASIAARLRVPT